MGRRCVRILGTTNFGNAFEQEINRRDAKGNRQGMHGAEIKWERFQGSYHNSTTVIPLNIRPRIGSKVE